MSIIKETVKYLALREDEPPPKKLISDGDKLIKSLAEKQQKTNVTIQDYLQHEKTFERYSEHISLTSCHSGTSSLDHFKDIIHRIEDIEHLRSAGLENEDIQLLWDYRQNNINVKYKNVEQSILENRIRKILELTQGYETRSDETISIGKKRNLNEEISLAEKPNSTETKLLKFAIDNKQKSSINSLVDSITDLKEIEKNRFSYLNDEKLSVKKVQKRIRNITTRIDKIGKNEDGLKEIKQKTKKLDHLYVENSKWDVKETEVIEKQKEKSKIYTCKPNNYYTIKNGEIVKLNEDEIQEKGLEISKYKLTIEEIKNLPRFENYNLGQPTNVLYLKNLPRNITEKDLQGIFKDFQNVTFRIMTGKMRGQVFVTFLDTTEASTALEKVNGLLINNKPMIVEYGKKKLT